MASSSRTPAARRSGRRPTSWSWWDEVNADRPTSGGGSRAWSCKFCTYRRTSGANKVRAHLLHERGHEVQFCMNISQEKKKELLDRVSTQEAYLASRPTRVAVDPAAYVTASSSAGSRGATQSSSTPSNVFSFMASAVPSQPQTSTSRPRQSTLHGSWDPKKKEETDAAVARFFYHDHIPFVAARSEYFKAMVKKIGEYGPNYVAPSSETLRTTLLDKEKRIVEQAAEVRKRQWEKYGVTLVADGWSDTRKRSIHGIVAYSGGEMYFISSHDASGTGKSADVLAAEWVSAIEIIGPQNVVGFVADGEPANRAAGIIVEGMYPHIIVSFCMAHCLNNLLKDIGGLSWIAPVIQKANQIVTFILNHQYLRHEYSLRAKKMLLKYSDTRFAYNFLMLGRLRSQMAAVKQLFISDEYTSCALAHSATGAACKANVENATFWEDVQRIDDMVVPIVHLLRLVDGMQPCIGKVYEAMDRMIEKLHALVPDEDDYEEIRALCITRWNAYCSPLHAAAYVLDPEFQGKGQEDDREVKTHWINVLNRLIPDRDKRKKVRDQLSSYREFRGCFGSVDAQEDRFRVGAARWWDDWGTSKELSGNELQVLARRILNQTVSSSCLEQLWSSYSHIASKKRNRLGVEKANDLVFVSANLRMLCKSVTKKLDAFTQWEMEQDEGFNATETHGAPASTSRDVHIGLCTPPMDTDVINEVANEAAACAAYFEDDDYVEDDDFEFVDEFVG